MSQTYDAATMNPASINTNTINTTVKRHTHNCRHRTTQPVLPPPQSSDLTTLNEHSTWQQWLYGIVCAIAIPVWYGFKTGAGTHLATWLFTRFGVLSVPHHKAVVHNIQYQYYIDGHATTGNKYSIATPAVLNNTQPTTHAATHHLQYPVYRPIIIPLHATH